jgi:hypothetical protein
MNLEHFVDDIEAIRSVSDLVTNHLLGRELGEILGLDSEFVFLAYKAAVARGFADDPSVLLQLMKLICRYRKPNEAEDYFCAQMVGDAAIEYYSITHYVNSVATRTPRKILGSNAYSFYLKHNIEYVIDRDVEMDAWLINWRGRALFSGSRLQKILDNFG